MRFTFLAVLFLLCTCGRAQELQLFESFTNHAVLQRNTDHPLWGWARPGTVVKVLFGEQRLSVKTGKDGRWRVLLPPTPAGGPHKISVQTKREAILLEDIYFGDVYLLSGQSNMEWRLRQSDPDSSRARSIADPLIRELKVKRSYATQPLVHLDIDEATDDQWMVGTAERIGEFSGVGSYFAHYVRKEVDVPIGLLHASWGGSRIEPWMSPAALGMEAVAENAVDEIMQAAGKEGRATFATVFPGRAIPTKDEGEALGWLRADFDDSRWPTMTLPTYWEAAGYPNVDGYFYFRRTFTLTSAQAAGPATLYLGAIDDGDWTYLNGTAVGSMPNAYAEPRVYTLPAGTLRTGENTIAIRVMDGGGGGGFSASPVDFRLETSAGAVNLAGNFRYNIGEFRAGGQPNQVPTILYNAMIAPLEGYPLTGVLWYQGESNAGPGDNERYADLMQGLVKQWRGFFKQPDLPFFWVQLANFQAAVSTPNEPGWAVLRNSQTIATALPRTGQAVITDIGEADDIHPRNKWEVGRRLSLHALKDIYGKKVQARSPVAKSAKNDAGFVVVRFAEVGGGLMVKSTDRYRYPTGLTIQDASGKWHFARALLDESENALFVEVPSGLKVKTVRYNWANNPDGNLFSKEGLPVTPFELTVN
ncbi:sialate O-acetylesterase [Neolewinella lacunae]|uniref:Beta galactosidase jelly roll domain-containing protein n=1 Tax=Neolewinella lacunae TaxID=1517758 RepID=A0A923T8J2_9BACT|nr:sialate O-acetylesterase [Neolewinella lacunae]MBC6994018.1 beta galactosidase jelly roll domain-containing protein [Neolewinella lacunae]MDN3634688.1 sialate O-acetylesterase [Neolewinella lacunae]